MFSFIKHLFIFSCFLLISSCTSFNKNKTTLKLLHYGIMISDSEKSYSRDINSTSGVLTSDITTSICKTTDIPMKMGLSFGLIFEIYNYPSQETFVVKTTTSHPEITGYDGKVSTVNIWDNTISYEGNNTHGGEAGFLFEEKYELKPGTWKISVNFNNQTIEKTFDVQDYHTLQNDLCYDI